MKRIVTFDADASSSWITDISWTSDEPEDENNVSQSAMGTLKVGMWAPKQHKQYSYWVPFWIYKGLKDADSPGRFFGYQIKPYYTPL